MLFIPFVWRKNYGIFTELKFHETDNVYYFECSEGLESYNEERNKKPCIDWFKKDFNRGKILFVPDITIFHKGEAKCIIEIVNTHPVSDKKLDVIQEFFKGHEVEVFEIFADEILRHDVSVVLGDLQHSYWKF